MRSFVARVLILGSFVPILVMGRAPAAPVDVYQDPPFAGECVLRQFGEGEAPDMAGYPDDPLCVEYDKREITLSDGGAAKFTAAEPARFAIAANHCRYWQRDHWSVQAEPGGLPLVTWDGSYWWDTGAGMGGARMENFRVAGVAAGPSQAADVIELLSPELAAAMRAYGEPGGGGGVSGAAGGGWCAG
ncbi:MAG: hypothetical protein WDA27_02770 [Actinomycetota bacterium]